MWEDIGKLLQPGCCGEQIERGARRMAENEGMDIGNKPDQGVGDGESKAETPGGRVWLLMLAFLGVLALYVVLGLFDRFTILIPDRGQVEEACFIIAGLGGLLSAGLAFRLTAKVGALRRSCAVVLLAFLGSLTTFLLSSRVANVSEGIVEFPAATTKTQTALIRISRAYQTHGKGASSNIQTTPIWSNLEIASTDFAFMREHRRPGDAGLNPDEISSRGYFCARLTVQINGHAIRVMHAGSQALPEGTVVVCPDGEGESTE